MFGQYDCSRLHDGAKPAKAKKVFLKTTNIYKIRRFKHAVVNVTKFTYHKYDIVDP
jgi:hypothetical protein